MEKEKSSYRLILTAQEVLSLKNLVERQIEKGLPSETLKSVQKKLKSIKPIAPTTKQLEAVKKATETRVKRTKKKIETAINQLRLENRPITMYAVAKIGRLSPNTVKKYKDLIKTAEAERLRNQPVEKTHLL